MRIFISYRRGDSSGHAGRLFDALQAHFGRGHVFMDVSGIDSGVNFVEAIDQAVRTCDALVAVIGDEWLNCAVDGTRRLDSPDDFVRTEIATALERGIPVVPVLVEQTSMPSAAALPGPLKALATRNAHELTDARWSYDVARLIRSLEKLGGKTGAWERRRWIAAAAVIATVVALAIAYRQMNSTDSDTQVAPTETGSTTPTTGAPPGNTPATGSATGRASAVDLAGDWIAEVKYSWGDTHPERFSFKVDGGEVLGTASFLRVKRGILDGTLTGNRVRFRTETQEILGNDTRDVTHHYRGTVSGDEIAFFMQSEGASSSEPVEFTARRVKPGLPAGKPQP